MKKLVLILLLSSINSFSQSYSSHFDKAVENFQKEDFQGCIKILGEIEIDDIIEQKQKAAIHFYKAESHFYLNQMSGAINEFEIIASNYSTSNYLDISLYRLGTLYFEKGIYEKSLRKLQKLTELFPESKYLPEALYWIALDYEKKDNFKLAEKNYLKSISLAESNSLIEITIYCLGRLYELRDDFQNAIHQYDKLLSFYGESPLAVQTQMRIGFSYFKLKKFDNAILELSDKNISSLSENSKKQAKYILASSFHELGEYDSEMKIYDELLKMNISIEEKENIIFNYTGAYLSLGIYKNAIQNLEYLKNSANENIAREALYWLSIAFGKSGKTNKAFDVAKEFISKYPNHPLAEKMKINKGNIEFSTNKIKSAEGTLLSSLENSQGEVKVELLTMLGEINLSKKKFSKSEQYFSNANQLTSQKDDNYVRIKFGLGVTQFYLNKLKLAEKNLTELRKDYKNFQKDRVNFYLAEIYLKNRKYKTAIELYKNVNKNNTELYADVLYGLGYAYFNQYDFNNCIYYFEEYLKKHRREHRHDSELRIAESFFGLKDFNNASKYYSRVLEAAPRLMNNAYYYYQYAQALFKSNQMNPAINYLRKLQNRFKKSNYIDDAQYLIGWIYFQQGEFNNAITEYHKTHSMYPKSAIIPITYYSIGDSYYNLGEYDSAYSYYSKILSEYPNTKYVIDAVNGIEFSYMARDQISNAVQFIDDYVNKENPPFADKVFIKRGEIYFSSADYRNAEKSYNQFIDRYPNSTLIPAAYFWSGKSSAMSGDSLQAIEKFTFVIDNFLSSDFGAASTIEAGRIYLTLKQFDEAILIFDKSISSIPNSESMPEILYLKSLSVIELGDINKSYELFNEIIYKYPESIFADKSRIELGLLELARNNLNTALDFFREVTNKRTDDIGAEAQYYYGLTYFNNSNFSEAINAFVRVRSVYSGYDEWYTNALLRLGDCYIKLKDKRKAREMFRAVIKRHSKDTFGKEAKQKLDKL